MIAALLAAMLAVVPSPPSILQSPDAVARRYGLTGELLIARGNRIVLNRAYGRIDPKRPARHRAGQRWRLASISKQVTAALIVKSQGTNLDAQLGYMSLRLGFRQLLTHHSGLANPDETPANAEGVPTFYTQARPDLRYCLSKVAVPGSGFSYNNCDYIVAAQALPGLFQQAKPWPAGMQMARPGEMGVPGFVGGRPEPHYELSSFGAAGGLIGTTQSVWRFDRTLMSGRLLPAEVRTALWKPEGGRSYQALGQWVFPGQLAGCTKPHRIVQRDGEIGGVQTRNYILPDDDVAVVLFTNRSADDFAIGEIWQGKGFAYDLLLGVVCR